MTRETKALVRESVGRCLRVAAYVRVSTDHESQEDSYELQERYFTGLLAVNPGWISAGVYSDYGITATNRLRRTGFNRLMRHCREGRIDRIVCKSISRFARNTADFLASMEMLKECGVSVFFEKENLDTANPTSEFILTTLGAIAQEESRSTSDSLKWANRRRYPKGEVPNGAFYGYRFAEGTDAWECKTGGYRIRRVEVVEREAAIVRRIFREYVEGRSMTDIARGLNRDLVPPPMEAPRLRQSLERERRVLRESGADGSTLPVGRGWTGSRVGYVLSQERYTGNVLVQKTFVESFLTHQTVKNRGELPRYYVMKHHPAIVSQELFSLAQERRKENPRAGVSRPFSKRAYTGLLRCGRCGRVFGVRESAGITYWRCLNSSAKAGNHRCRNDWISEEQVARMLRRALFGRFDLINKERRDVLVTKKILRGKVEELDLDGLLSSVGAGFLERMVKELERFLREDCVEKERSYYRRRLFLEKQLLGEWRAARGMRQRMVEDRLRLERLEQYWEMLEEGHECRVRALDWMRSLKGDADGLVHFLSGMKTEYVRALVLEVVVFSGDRYRVRWYDNTITDVVFSESGGAERNE